MFVIYVDGANEWRWRFVAANGRTIAVSSEGYNNRRDCLNGIKLVQESSTAEVFCKLEEDE